MSVVDVYQVRLLAWLRRARSAMSPGVVAAGLAAVVAAGGVVAPQIARADTSADAQREADALLARVHQIQAQVAAAEKQYDAALAGVAASVTTAIQTERMGDRLAVQAAAARAQLDDRVRALYMSGGPLALYATVLDSGNFLDAEAGAATVSQVVRSAHLVAAAGDAATAQARRLGHAADATARERIRTERSVAQVAGRVQTLLAEEQTLLDRATARVAHLKEVEAERARLAAAAAAMSSLTANRIASLQVLPPPPSYLALYKAAATTCPGLSWTVLASIGQVESGHGRDTSTSYAGAMGPMQFLPATFIAFAVDGDGDRTADIQNPADAIYTAARYLCSNGAGQGGQSLYGAIWHYNHADWYVQMVLALAQKYAA